jgi:hypothetical protein
MSYGTEVFVDIRSRTPIYCLSHHRGEFRSGSGLCGTSDPTAKTEMMRNQNDLQEQGANLPRAMRAGTRVFYLIYATPVIRVI